MFLRREEKRKHRDCQSSDDIITDRFFLLGSFPRIGRSREGDFCPGYRSLTVAEYVIVYRVENDDALIIRIVHGRRDMETLFGH